MTVDADDLEVRQRGRLLVDLQRIFVDDAELVFLESGRNVRMRLGIDVRIDAQADRRDLSEPSRDGALRRSKLRVRIRR